MYVCKHSKLECSGDKGVSDIESLIYELYGKTTRTRLFTTATPKRGITLDLEMTNANTGIGLA